MSLMQKLTVVVALAGFGACGGGGGGGGGGGPALPIDPLTQAALQSIFNDAAIAGNINTQNIFTLGVSPFDATFGGRLMSIAQPGLYISPSSVAWGVNGAGNAAVSFNGSPAAYVIVRARNGLNPADSMLLAIGGLGTPLGPLSLPDNAFQTFAFAGDITTLQLENSTDGAVAVIGEVEAKSFDIATNFGGAAFDSNRGLVQFNLGAAPFEASFNGRVMTVGVPELYVGDSSNAFGVTGAGTATIEFTNAPARLVSIQARGTDGTNGQGVADAEIRTFGPGGALETFNLPNSQFAPLSLRGEITRIEIVNVANTGLALVGLIAAQGNTLDTRFDGTFGATVFDDLVGAPAPFTLTAGNVAATFDGLILNTPGLSFPPSENAFGVTGDSTASITFATDVGIVVGRVRGTGADIGLPEAASILTVRDAADQVIGTLAVPNDQFAYFQFTGAIASMELSNTVDGASAVIGEITALKTD